MTTPAHPARARWRVVLLAALAVVLALLLPSVPASATALPASETRVGASGPATTVAVGVHDCITAGQRPVRGPSQPQIVVGNCVAAEAGGGSGRLFVTSGRGTTYDVPQGWAGRNADNGKGLVYQRPGASGNADSFRIMEPTSKYPNGYVRVYNSRGQPVDVHGKPGPPADTHIPQDYVGPWPGWPGR